MSESDELMKRFDKWWSGTPMSRLLWRPKHVYQIRDFILRECAMRDDVEARMTAIEDWVKYHNKIWHSDDKRRQKI